MPMNIGQELLWFVAYCDGQRRFMWRDNEPVLNFGRMRGKSLRAIASDPNERKYLRWFLEGSFDEDAKGIVREALLGRIRRRSHHSRPPRAAVGKRGAPVPPSLDPRDPR